MKLLLLIDIDNTLAENKQRESLLPNWEAFFKACDTDTSITPILQAITPYLNHAEIEVMFVTGRQEYDEVKEKTQIWLQERNIQGYPIHYRPHSDYSKSFLFKEKVLAREKKDEHALVVILDDDKTIIEHFTNLGHSAVHVNSENNYQDTCLNLGNKINSLLEKLTLLRKLDSKTSMPQQTSKIA